MSYNAYYNSYYNAPASAYYGYPAASSYGASACASRCSRPAPQACAPAPQPCAAPQMASMHQVPHYVVTEHNQNQKWYTTEVQYRQLPSTSELKSVQHPQVCASAPQPCPKRC